MTWNVTMLFVHLFGLFALAALYRHAPDSIQKIVVGLLAVAFLILVYAYASAITGAWMHWMVVRVAHSVEHIAVLVYVFRLFIADQERRCLPNSSQHSHSSPR